MRGVAQREVQGKTYYQCEFTAKAGVATRQQLATVAISNGTRAPLGGPTALSFGRLPTAVDCSHSHTLLCAGERWMDAAHARCCAGRAAACASATAPPPFPNSDAF